MMIYNLLKGQIQKKILIYLFFYVIILIIYLFALTIHKENSLVNFINFFQNSIVLSSFIIPFFLFGTYQIILMPTEYQYIRINKKKLITTCNLVLVILSSSLLSVISIIFSIGFKIICGQSYWFSMNNNFEYIFMIISIFLSLTLTLSMVGIIFLTISSIFNYYLANLFIVISLFLFIGYSQNKLCIYLNSFYTYTITESINLVNMFLYMLRSIIINIILIVILYSQEKKKEFYKKRRDINV